MESTSPWAPLLSAAQREQVLTAVLQVAAALADPPWRPPAAGGTGPGAWPDPWIAAGPAGLALFFGQLDRCYPDAGWDRVAHRYLTLASDLLQAQRVDAHRSGLWSGTAGLCGTAFLLSRDGTRYARLLRTLDGLLTQQLQRAFDAPVSGEAGVGWDDYDLLHGPSGVGAYVLLRQDEPALRDLLGQIVHRLVALSGVLRDGAPFFMPPDRQPTVAHRARYPAGATDCGLAHGVPGPLAFLALVSLQRVAHPGLDSAIRRLAEWLLAQQCGDAWGPNWPAAVEPAGGSPAPPARRAGWCYGSPGVARALWLAGSALGDRSLQGTAMHALRAVYTRPPAARGLTSPMFCHGLAGLLQIVLRCGHDSGEAWLAVWAADLTQEIQGLVDSGSLVGRGQGHVDSAMPAAPGLLEGAAGIALALLAASTPVPPLWDRLTLLA